MKKEYDWAEIQKFYDEGRSWRDIRDKFGISLYGISNAVSSGDFVSRSRSESQKISLKQQGRDRSHSVESKRKISKARKKFLEDNPDKVPYLMNHYSKGMSYPEKYFKKVFINENINLLYHFRLNSYELDFADPLNKIDIEVDGEQHYLDKRIVEHDIRRNEFLEKEGWFVYRIRWSFFKNLDKDLQIKYVKDICDIIESRQVIGTSMKIYEEYINDKNIKCINRCKDCGCEICKGSIYCVTCLNNYRKNNVKNRKVKNRPSKEELVRLLQDNSWVKIGKMYNVSDNSIRKWAKLYQII